MPNFLHQNITEYYILVFCYDNFRIRKIHVMLGISNLKMIAPNIMNKHGYEVFWIRKATAHQLSKSKTL